jgi:hypothetical protein
MQIFGAGFVSQIAVGEKPIRRASVANFSYQQSSRATVNLDRGLDKGALLCPPSY